MTAAREAVLFLLVISCAGEGLDVNVDIIGGSGSLNTSLIQKESGLSFLSVGVAEEVNDFSTVLCKPGYFCPLNSSTQTPCPLGTYNPIEGQHECLDCPLSTYSFSNETMRTSCEQCPKGLYTLTTATQRIDQCLQCPKGYSCAGGGLPSPCPVGTYNPYEGRGECDACPLGTYSNDEHRMSICPPCPANSVCPSPSKRTACPAQTTSADGSVFMWECKCLPGYECAYKRQVVVSFRFNSTQVVQQTTLENNAALIEGLRQSVARASGVDLSKVTFRGFRLASSAL